MEILKASSESDYFDLICGFYKVFVALVCCSAAWAAASPSPCVPLRNHITAFRKKLNQGLCLLFAVHMQQFCIRVCVDMAIIKTCGKISSQVSHP